MKKIERYERKKQDISPFYYIGNLYFIADYHYPYIYRFHDAHQLLSDNQQKWKIKLDRGKPDSDGDIPNVVSIFFLRLKSFHLSSLDIFD